MAQAAEVLRGRLRGRVSGPGDDDWDAARGAYNLLLDQRPEAVVTAEDEDDCAAAVRAAADLGLRVAVQGTGHGAGARPSLEGAILLRTERLQGVEVDPVARVARLRAGARWADVVAATEPHGLHGLAGTAPTVRVAGYALGGGIGFLARRHGLAANSILAADVVTADGRRLRVDAGNHPDLFWALRGGGGSFAVVTGLEIAVYPVPSIHAGALYWPVERAREVIATWLAMLPGLPREITTTARVLRFPPIPDVPEPFRGRAFVAVQGAFLGGEAEGRRLWAPLLALAPEFDMLALMPPSGLGTINGDPPEPVPYGGDGGLLADLPLDAVDAALAVHGPEPGSALLGLELRQLGGALAEAPEGAGCLGAIAAPFAWFAVGIAPVPEAAAAVERDLDRLHAAFAPWDAGRAYMNFAERPVGGDALLGADVHARLRAIRAEWDPDGRLLANHPVGGA